MIRSFVAIEIPLTADLANLLDRLKKSGSRLSVPRAEGVHITIKFLGDVQEDRMDRILTILREAASSHSRFEAKVRGTGAFPSPRNPRVLWVGIEDGGAMGRLAESVDKNLAEMGFEREKRPFTPHVTVARVKSSSGIERAIEILNEYETTEFGSFTVADMKLKKSTLTPSGSIYEDIGVIPLLSPDKPRA